MTAQPDTIQRLPRVKLAETLPEQCPYCERDPEDAPARSLRATWPHPGEPGDARVLACRACEAEMRRVIRTFQHPTSTLASFLTLAQRRSLLR